MVQEAAEQAGRAGALISMLSGEGRRDQLLRLRDELAQVIVAAHRVWRTVYLVEAPLNVREPYVLMVPTYGGGDAKKAVPPQVKRFLNNPANRAWIRGVVASGNTNFGTAYCAAGAIIAAKCRVPFLSRFELMGTREDTRKVRDGLVRFFRDHRG